MKLANRTMLVLAVAVLADPACKDDRLGSTMTPQVLDAGTDADAETGTDAGDTDALLCGRPGAGGTSEVPPEHRALALACSPGKNQPPLPDGGAPTCTTSADCAADGGTFYNTCLHGVCSFDQCLTDADCPSGVCGCSSDYYGGNSAYHPNVCVPSNCHIDSDCGPGGYCSPSRGHCGAFTGFYCHQPTDTCMDPTMDCAGCGSGGGSACVYQPAVGLFVCGQSLCAG